MEPAMLLVQITTKGRAILPMSSTKKDSAL